MNELNNTNAAAKIRRRLLATASALVLAAYGDGAQAADRDRPTVWIEGGAQFESVVGKSDPFAPSLDAATTSLGFPSVTALENVLGRSFGGEGSISFQPHGSDWVFTAAARYGRVQTARRTDNKTTIVGPQLLKGGGILGPAAPFTPTFGAYAIGYSKNSEAHAIVDFQVGRDVGVGLLGRGTDTVISFGARYAQMNAKTKGNSYANVDPSFLQLTSNGFFGHKYLVHVTNPRSATFMERTDSVQALGPSLSMKNTTGLLGTVDDGQLALDWGMNAALLFGRQKMKLSHHSTIANFTKTIERTIHAYAPEPHMRSRMVTIPNLGGFAGLSYRIQSAKFSAGYRADFFFGAKDSGLETRRTTDVGFHGPFATISIGLGG